MDLSLKKISVAVILLIVLLIGAYFAFGKNNEPVRKEKMEDVEKDVEEKRKALPEERIGWITDLHVSNKEKVRINDQEVIHADAYKKYLPAFFREMQAEKIKTVMVTGDMTHDGDRSQARELVNIANKFDVKVLWVRGNHDQESSGVMDDFEIDSPYYYSYDTGKSRIIVLNVTDNKDGVSQKQLKWLKERLEETKLDNIVALHVPLIDFKRGATIGEFEELEKIIRESGKVKLVVAGSLHDERKMKMNGVLHMTAYPLTLEDHLGSYYIIEKIKSDWKVVGKNLEAVK